MKFKGVFDLALLAALVVRWVCAAAKCVWGDFKNEKGRPLLFLLLVQHLFSISESSFSVADCLSLWRILISKVTSLPDHFVRPHCQATFGYFAVAGIGSFKNGAQRNVKADLL